nr:MAG TPA: hypothetical protein [Caudoviricetes sp.]
MNNVRAKNRVCNRERVPFNTRTLIFSWRICYD